MIKIICFGKLKEKYMEELCDDYIKRISRYHKIEIINLKDELKQEKETNNLLNILKKSDYNIVLDMHGNNYTSEQFASHVNLLFNNHSTITFIIGSSFGLDEKIKKEANELISFSYFTMPHGLFRGVLLEQIYRSFKINNNEEYHK